ncbi:MAG: hypothetical protein K2P44_02660 [Lachnospiraceae bacterium]|nr:hypothetical protein [Lachnospiraceae bacterium]
MKNDEKQFQSFRLRVHACWEHFLQSEEQLRQLIDQKADSEAIAERIASLLTPAFNDVSAEVGFNGEKHELILNLDGNWARVFPLIYFQKQAPAKVLEHWNILIGRQSREIDRQKEKSLGDYQIQISGNSVCIDEIQVWTVWENEKANVSIYCEKLAALLPEKESEAYWIAYVMLDYAVGELAEMSYVRELEVLAAPHAEPSMTLAQLPSQFMEQLSLTVEELFDPERYCARYSAYRMEPNEDADDGLRGDVFTGSSCLISLLNAFWSEDTYIMDTFEQDGVTAGYFCYPLGGFTGDDRGAQILDFRDNTAMMIENTAGAESFTYIGGATGIHFGYLDFISWDIKAVLDAAVSVFEKSGIDWVMFHSFRQDDEGITLFEKETT